MGSHRVHKFLLVLGICLLASCGGGSGGGGASSSAATFSLSVTPSNASIFQGSSKILDIQVASTGGFSGSVTITVSGLPAGVTTSPSSLVVAAGSSASLDIHTEGTTSVGQTQVTLTGVSGSQTIHDAFTLTIEHSPRYLEVGGAVVAGFYDQSRDLLFAANEGRNEIDVISGSDLSLKARVSVPVPSGIDQAADGKTIVVGTLTQGVYTIDEQTLAVTQYLCPDFSFTDDTVFPFRPAAMANGKILLLGNEWGMSEGVVHLLELNPATGKCTEPSLPGANSSGGVRQVFSDLQRSANHKWAVIASYQNIYLYNSDSDSFTYTSVPTGFGAVSDVAANPDGTQFAVIGNEQVLFYDQGLNLTGTVSTSNGTLSFHHAVYGADGSRLYWQTGGNANGIGVVDTAKFTELGDITSVFDINGYLPSTYLLAVDSSQRAFIGDGGVVATLDCSKPRVGAPSGNPNSVLPNPKAIPLNTSQTILYGVTVPDGTTVDFAGSPGIIKSYGMLQVVPPPSSVPGPVDTVFTLLDGEAYMVPNGFAYGVTVASAAATLVPPTGNPWMALFGYGMVNEPFGAPTVTVGGQQASNVQVNNDLTTTSAWEEIYAQVPNGQPGPADVTVSGNNGTGTLTAAVTYIPSATVIPQAGVTKVLYDPHRNVVYALSPTQTDVLNATTLQWQAAIPVGGTAMALTPDGSKLLVGNSALYIINPDSPSQMTWTQLPATVATLAPTNTGKVFIAFASNTTASPIEFDLATMTYKDLTTYLSAPGYTEFAGTPDGTHVNFAVNLGSGGVGSWNAATDSFTSQGLTLAFWTDVAVSPDGSEFASLETAPGYAGTLAAFWDQNLHLLNWTYYPDLAPPITAGSLGAIFSPSGRTLLVPTGDAIEFFDTRTGALRGRVLSPENMPVITFPTPCPGGIAIDPTGQTIYAVSNSGITVFKLPVPVDQIAAPASFSASESVPPPAIVTQTQTQAETTGATRLTLRDTIRLRLKPLSRSQLRLLQQRR